MTAAPVVARSASERQARPLAERATTADPPVAQPARKRYWDDTVMEAVGELRRRLNSSRESVVTMAVLSILEVEKTRMRTGRPVSGTHVSHVRDDDGSLPKLGPLEVDQPPVSRKSEPEASATVPAEPPADHGERNAPIAQVSEQTTPQPATVRPTRERGPPADADQPPVVVARRGERVTEPPEERPASGRAAEPTTTPPNTS